MNILTYIPVWQRRSVTRICYEGLGRIYDAAPKGCTFTTLIVASNEEDAALAEEYGFEVFRFANRPLGRKFNAGIEYALDNYAFDFVFQLNSDDLLSTDFWSAGAKFSIADYVQGKAGDLPLFGVDWVYVYEARTMKVRRLKYSIGCGIRFIRRDILETVRAQQEGDTFDLWHDHKNGGLDNQSMTRILERTRRMPYFPRTKAPLVVDIKTETNIHPFSEFELCKPPDAWEQKALRRRFPELRQLETLLIR